MLTPEEQQRQRTRRRKRLVIAASLLVLLGIGILFARPVRREIKGWQARRHAAKAFAHIEAGKLPEARNAALAAYQLHSTEPESIRAIARFLSRTGQAQALEFWDRLRTASSLMQTDLRDEARIALLVGDLQRAEQSLGTLMSAPAHSVTPGDHLLAAQLAQQSGRPHEAVPYLQKVLEDRRASSDELLQAAMLQLNVPGGGEDAIRERQNAAWTKIADIARQADGAAALEALARLAGHILRGGALPDVLALTPSEVVEHLERHPSASAVHRLLATDLKLQQHPEARETLVNQAVERWQNGTSSEIAALATWLNSNGEHQRVLDVFPADRAVTDRDLFLQHADALGALGRWSEIKQLLESDRFPLPAVVQKMYLARCNEKLGERVAAENNWLRALEAAENNPQDLHTVAEYAEKNGNLALAARAYASLASIAPKAKIAYVGQLRVARAMRDTRMAHSILERMVELWPTDTGFLSNEAYLRLLLVSPDDPSAGSVARGAEELAQKLTAKEPNSLTHRSLLALARLRQDRARDALEAFGDIRPELLALSASAAALRAIALAKAGRPDEATTQAQAIRRSSLTPEEQSLLDSPTPE